MPACTAGVSGSSRAKSDASWRPRVRRTREHGLSRDLASDLARGDEQPAGSSRTCCRRSSVNAVLVPCAAQSSLPPVRGRCVGWLGDLRQGVESTGNTALLRAVGECQLTTSPIRLSLDRPDWAYRLAIRRRQRSPHRTLFPTGHPITSITTCGDARSLHLLLLFDQAKDRPQRSGDTSSRLGRWGHERISNGRPA